MALTMERMEALERRLITLDEQFNEHTRLIERQKEVLWDALQMEFAGYKYKLEVITMDAGAEFEKMRNLLQALYDDTDGRMKG